MSTAPNTTAPTLDAPASAQSRGSDAEVRTYYNVEELAGNGQWMIYNDYLHEWLTAHWQAYREAKKSGHKLRVVTVVESTSISPTYDGHRAQRPNNQAVRTEEAKTDAEQH